MRFGRLNQQSAEGLRHHRGVFTIPPPTQRRSGSFFHACKNAPMGRWEHAEINAHRKLLTSVNFP